MPNTTESEILTQDLGMKHIVAKFVLWLLLPEQKEQRGAVANSLIRTATKEPWGPGTLAFPQTKIFFQRKEISDH